MGEQQEIKWIGGVSAGQDVTIRLVRKGATEETLAVVKVQSTVLSTFSKYFNTCLSERWGNLESSPKSSRKVTFVLEAQADVDFYFHCFARMYTPIFKNDVFDVKYGLGLLKVASQIEFHELIDSTSLYLSSTFWSKEDEIRVREYSSSPDFPRNHAKDLVARLGLDILDKSELEDHHEQLWLVIHQIIRTPVKPESDNSEVRSGRVFIAELLQSVNGPTIPYQFASKVINLVTGEGKGLLVSFGKECEERNYLPQFQNKVVAICWVLKALLMAKLAEELVLVFVHLDAIPNASYQVYTSSHRIGYHNDLISACIHKLAEVVFLMYAEVVAGHLVLRTPERMALLANWHPLLKEVYVTPEQHLIGEENLN